MCIISLCCLGSPGALLLDHNRLLALQNGTGTTQGSHAQVLSVLVLANDVPQAVEGGTRVLVDGDLLVRVDGFVLACTLLQHYDDSLAVGSWLHTYGLPVHQTIEAERVLGLQVVGLSAVCHGFSLGSHEEMAYGDTHHMRLRSRTHFIEFSPKYSSNITVLWKRGDHTVILNRKYIIIGVYLAIYRLTQNDSGRYIMKDKDLKELSTYTLEVKATTRAYEKNAGEHFDVTFDLEPNSCNIYFFPESDPHPRKLKNEILRQGRLQRGLDELDCVGFDLLEPCGILNEDLQMSCNGRYEIRDQNGDTAVVVSLETEAIPYKPSRTGIGAGVFFVSLICYCVKWCCCRKSKSKEDGAETVAAESDVPYQEYDNEPVGARFDRLIQPSGAHNPTQPSYTLTGPLVYDHPTVNLPPAYSEVSASAEQPDAPTVPVHSDPEPKFELNGMNFPSAPPLGSDSTYCDVYTSEKLNFI